MTFILRWACALLFLLCNAVPMASQSFTRGIGVYPGRPSESAAPRLIPDDGKQRNIALGRCVYQSGSHDFNLTSQLLTDGIVSYNDPVWLDVSVRGTLVSKREAESAIDGNDWTQTIVTGNDTWLQYDWHGMSIDADELELMGSMAFREDVGDRRWQLRCLVSEDGQQWQQVGELKDDTLPGKPTRSRVHSDPNKNTGSDLLPTRWISEHLQLHTRKSFSHLRLELKCPAAAYWVLRELTFKHQKERVENLLPSSKFSSAWMSEAGKEAWVYVDLGRRCAVDEVRLHWIRRAQSGQVQLSDDATAWCTVGFIDDNGSRKENISVNDSARYVRLLLHPSDGKRVALTELEVIGRGGLVAEETGWRLRRASEVKVSGEELSREGYDDSRWMVATVPATVLMSYVNAGALPDPNYDNNLQMASESFFNSNFWYRKVFQISEPKAGRRVFLNFDGVNWKAHIYLNGTRLDHAIEGAFERASIDVTPYLRRGNNVLAIEVEKNAHPGAVKLKNERSTDFNGGRLGIDNPTFHATVGWDWISTIRGRDIGLWNDVYLSEGGDVTLHDPYVRTTLNAPDTLASMTATVVLRNHSDQSVTGLLRGWIGEKTFEKRVTIPSHSEKEVEFSPEDFPQLRQQAMKLWWPNGYGTPYLYASGFSFDDADRIEYAAGIREVTYKDVDTQLKIYVNGRRVTPLGGNWGFSENNLCYRKREYDIAVRYHKDMNFNMIRNWVGQIGDKEFYESCDRYGIMVWQDFWLANPADGPDPADETMFMRNARDYVSHIRRHPSIVLYCGRNEGYPPATLDKALRDCVGTLHRDLTYISSSADDGVSGHGPYWALPSEEYFARQTGKLHTERGMPNVMSYESLCRTLRPEHLWPQNEVWGQHDYTQEGAQRGATFNQLISKGFGEPRDAKEFCEWAQWINFEGYRAMYESSNQDRLGLLIWMSHPCWPTMVWQTYDYFFEPTAAYFGAKKACQPLHIQWNAHTRKVSIVNRSGADRELTADVQLTDIHGKSFWSHTTSLRSHDDSTIDCIDISEPKDVSGVYFILLTLRDANGVVRDKNTYLCSTNSGNFQQLHQLPRLQLHTSATFSRQGDVHRARVRLENQHAEPAMMIRLNLKGSDGEQILPVLYSDNYFHLMPGETREITLEWADEDARGSAPQVEISGLNVEFQVEKP